MLRTGARRLAVVPIVAAGLVLSLSGCSQLELHGFLPGFQSNQPAVTNHTKMVSDLWVGSWLVLLSVGVVTWSLIILAAIVYRRRRGQTGLPVQLRYNMPIEVFYTVTPLILLLGLFAFTARDQNEIEKRFVKPDVTIGVFGKQWAWDFNYVNEKVFSAGQQAQPVAEGTPDTGFVQSKLPVLYLPVGKKVELRLRTRDVNHSFWVIDFLYKKDLIAGQENYEDFIPQRIGTYQGKCAELCGEYHSRMLFVVKVVSPADYQAQIAKLRAAGNIGQLGKNLDRDNNSFGAGSQDSGVPVGSETNRRGGNKP